VDGAVYAEPLIAAGRVIVATENDSVYAFSASSGHLLWRTHLGSPVPGADLPCGDINPSGITGTPVIDTRRGLVYSVAFEQGPKHVLFALDLATGTARWQRPIDPPGADPRVQQQRAALALSHGRVYVAYGGLYGDCGDYHGWVVAVPSSGPAGSLISYRVPTRREGGIWAPSGPAVDTAGNLYVATGNGSSSSFDYGNAVIRLTPALKPTGFFAPPNAGALNQSDADLGSTGPLLLPGARAFIIGKSGVGYLLNASRLGGIGHPLASLAVCGGAFGGLAYAGGRIFIPCTSGIVALQLIGHRLREVWHQAFAPSPPIVTGSTVWAIGGGSLYGFAADTGRVRFKTSIGETAHFATPAASGERLFVAVNRRVMAFS
jgi:outer membrane protein assembly factor BamB